MGACGEGLESWTAMGALGGVWLGRVGWGGLRGLVSVGD